MVSAVEEVIPEALCDSGADPEYLGHVLPTDHHVSVVELNVHIRLLIQQVVSSSSRRQTHQLPEVTGQLMTSRSLVEEEKRRQASHNTVIIKNVILIGTDPPPHPPGHSLSLVMDNNKKKVRLNLGLGNLTIYIYIYVYAKLETIMDIKFEECLPVFL